MDKNNNWINAKCKDRFLFPVKAMSVVFRAKFMALLRKSTTVDASLSKALFTKKWVVFAKRPFGNVNSVIEYLGRYTHKIAISNHRLTNVGDEHVSFSYKDYKHGGVKKEMSLTLHEFIRRFSLHILPKRHVRIRHFGILSSTQNHSVTGQAWKRGNLKLLQQSLGVAEIPTMTLQKSTRITVCPCCKMGTLQTIDTFDGRGPPKYTSRMSKKTKTAIIAA